MPASIKFKSICTVVSMTRMDAYAMPTSNTDYSYYIKAIKLIDQSYGVYITPLVIHSFGGRHIHTHTYKCLHRSNSKKPDTLWPVRTWFKNGPARPFLANKKWSSQTKNGPVSRAQHWCLHYVYCGLFKFLAHLLYTNELARTLNQ